MLNLIADGKIINEMNGNADSYYLNEKKNGHRIIKLTKYLSN